MAYVYIANDLIYTHANTVTTQFEPKDYGSVKGLTGSDLTTTNAKFAAFDTAMQPLIDAGTLVVENSPADAEVKYQKYTFTTTPPPAETYFGDILDDAEPRLSIKRCMTILMSPGQQDPGLTDRNAFY